MGPKVEAHYVGKQKEELEEEEDMDMESRLQALAN